MVNQIRLVERQNNEGMEKALARQGVVDDDPLLSARNKKKEEKKKDY